LDKSGTVEGKIHLPLKETDKIVLFEPGFPGGISIEQLWLKYIKNNYAVFSKAWWNNFNGIFVWV
jgi:hypothetical protein